MGFKMFKPAVLAAFIGTVLLSSVSVQAASKPLNMLRAIEAAETHSGKKAISAELNGSPKRGTWEIDVVGPDGYKTELVLKVKGNGRIHREYEDYDNDDLREDKDWYKKVDKGTYLSLSEAVIKAQKTWKGSKATEAGFDDDKDDDDYYDRYDNDRSDDDDYDRDDERDDERDDDRDDERDDERDDDRDDERDNDRNQGRYSNPHYEIELEKGRNERDVTVKAKK